ncbi:ABC transporter permease [Candidatus Cloacimonadota bacterium]
MIKNYFRSALKNLIKNKFFTLINLLGLGIGITGLFLVYVFISHEQSFDTYHLDHELIFRVNQKEIISDDMASGEHTAPPLAYELKSTIPEIEASCRILQMSDRIIKTERFSDYEGNFILTDPAFFDIFTTTILNGNVKEAIKNPENVIITKRIAEKYFNTLNVAGKTLSIRGKDYNVGGVISDPPSHSHLKYDILCSMDYIPDPEFHQSAWLWHAIGTYVKLNPEADWHEVNEKIKIIKNEAAIERFIDAGLDYNFFLQPISNIRQVELTENGIIKSPSARNVSIFRLLAVFVLFLACLNFVNLTLALYFRRIKEVSIRKIIGAHPKDLIRQFLMETFIVILFAAMLSVFLIELSIPAFLNFTGIPADYLQQISLTNLLIFSSAILGVGLASGIYPAIFASSHKVMKIIGHGKVKLTNSIIRPILIVAQFTIAVIIIIVMLSMQQQVNFMQNRDLGFDSSHKLILEMRHETKLNEKYETYKDMFSQIPGVNGITASGAHPGNDFSSYYIETNDEELGKVQKTMNCFSIDHDFLPIYEVELVAGRNFDSEIDTDPNSVFLMSESGTKHMGWQNPQDALGKEIITGNGSRSGKIVGVIKDFNYMSLQYDIAPLFLEYYTRGFSYLTLNVQHADLTNLIKQVEQKWQTEFAGIPFKYFFADDAFNQQYINEMKAITLMKFFGLVAIVIACFGLVGISLFVTQMRFKEIGIRKVLGATLMELLSLLNTRFLVLIGIANLIAWPIAYFALQKWLQNFAYKMNLQIGIFLLAGLFSSFIFILTLSFQTIKAANTNPVKVLKYE